MSFEVSTAVERLKLSAKQRAGVVLYSASMKKNENEKGRSQSGLRRTVMELYRGASFVTFMGSSSSLNQVSKLQSCNPHPREIHIARWVTRTPCISGRKEVGSYICVQFL